MIDTAKKIKIAYIAAGAAGMYCGSCMRDNTLVKAIIKKGHEVALIPTYTPMRTDEQNVSIDRVFYNGINVFLQQKFSALRNGRGLVDKLLDNKKLINMVSRMNASTDAKDLGSLTVSVLKGEEGNQAKELEKLLEWLKSDYQPQIVQITNSMFAGLARRLRQELNVPVLCAMQGEDIFLDDLIEPYRTEAMEILRDRAKDIDGFIATSDYYRDFMTGYLNVPSEKIHTVKLGINMDGHGRSQGPGNDDVFTIGYLARVCPEKGLHHLVDALAILVEKLGSGKIRLRTAGYLGKRDFEYFKDVKKKIKKLGLDDHFEYLGEVDRDEKIAFYNSVHVFSVPTPYKEPKGLSIIEAMANGVPVVQPEHGSFPEIVNATGGGLLVAPEDPAAIADGILELFGNAEKRKSLGQNGKQMVHQNYTDDAMAEETLAVYRKYL